MNNNNKDLYSFKYIGEKINIATIIDEDKIDIKNLLNFPYTKLNIKEDKEFTLEKSTVETIYNKSYKTSKKDFEYNIKKLLLVIQFQYINEIKNDKLFRIIFQNDPKKLMEYVKKTDKIKFDFIKCDDILIDNVNLKNKNKIILKKYQDFKDQMLVNNNTELKFYYKHKNLQNIYLSLTKNNRTLMEQNIEQLEKNETLLSIIKKLEEDIKINNINTDLKNETLLSIIKNLQKKTEKNLTLEKKLQETTNTNLILEKNLQKKTNTNLILEKEITNNEIKIQKIKADLLFRIQNFDEKKEENLLIVNENIENIEKIFNDEKNKLKNIINEGKIKEEELKNEIEKIKSNLNIKLLLTEEKLQKINLNIEKNMQKNENQNSEFEKLKIQHTFNDERNKNLFAKNEMLNTDKINLSNDKINLEKIINDKKINYEEMEIENKKLLDENEEVKRIKKILLTDFMTKESLDFNNKFLQESNNKIQTSYKFLKFNHNVLESNNKNLKIKNKYFLHQNELNNIKNNNFSLLILKLRVENDIIKMELERLGNEDKSNFIHISTKDLKDVLLKFFETQSDNLIKTIQSFIESKSIREEKEDEKKTIFSKFGTIYQEWITKDNKTHTQDKETKYAFFWIGNLMYDIRLYFYDIFQTEFYIMYDLLKKNMNNEINYYQILYNKDNIDILESYIDNILQNLKTKLNEDYYYFTSLDYVIRVIINDFKNSVMQKYRIIDDIIKNNNYKIRIIDNYLFLNKKLQIENNKFEKIIQEEESKELIADENIKTKGYIKKEEDDDDDDEFPIENLVEKNIENLTKNMLTRYQNNILQLYASERTKLKTHAQVDQNTFSIKMYKKLFLFIQYVEKEFNTIYQKHSEKKINENLILNIEKTFKENIKTTMDYIKRFSLEEYTFFNNFNDFIFDKINSQKNIISLNNKNYTLQNKYEEIDKKLNICKKKNEEILEKENIYNDQTSLYKKTSGKNKELMNTNIELMNANNVLMNANKELVNKNKKIIFKNSQFQLEKLLIQKEKDELISFYIGYDESMENLILQNEEIINTNNNLTLQNENLYAENKKLDIENENLKEKFKNLEENNIKLFNLAENIFDYQIINNLF